MAGSLEDLLTELFAPLGGVSLRKMFGGVGVFKDAIIFGLVADGTLYLRADAVSQARFVAENAPQFVYTGMKGHKVPMRYFQLPERLYDEPEEFIVWSETAFAIARQAAVEKARSKKPAKADVSVPKAAARVVRAASSTAGGKPTAKGKKAPSKTRGTAGAARRRGN